MRKRSRPGGERWYPPDMKQKTSFLRWFCLLAACCVSLLVVVSTTALAVATNPLKLLQQMAETEDFEVRRVKCEEARAGHPPTFVRAFCDGYLALDAGLEAVSDEYLELSLKEEPEFALGCILFADAHVERGSLDRAAALYRRAIAIQPERKDARFSLGELLLERGQNENKGYLPEALETFRQMTELDPSSPDGWSNMANVLVYMDRFHDAKQILAKAITKAPREPFLFDQLASVHARNDENAEAEENWKKAIALNPGYGKAAMELAALFGREDRLVEALEVLERARLSVDAPPWGIRIRRNLGFLYLALGERARAAELLHEGRKGRDALSYLGGAHLLLLADDPIGAADLFEQGAALDETAAGRFLSPWKDRLLETRNADLRPKTAALLAKTSADSKAGDAATHALCSYVLEGWSLKQLDAARSSIAAGRSGSIETAFDVPPKPIKEVQAQYPESAQERGQGGLVLIAVTVDERGTVIEAKVEKSNAVDLLVDAALAAAWKWTFAPATRYGTPVRATITIPFQFRPQQ